MPQPAKKTNGTNGKKAAPKDDDESDGDAYGDESDEWGRYGEKKVCFLIDQNV